MDEAESDKPWAHPIPYMVQPATKHGISKLCHSAIVAACYEVTFRPGVYFLTDFWPISSKMLDNICFPSTFENSIEMFSDQLTTGIRATNTI